MNIKIPLTAIIDFLGSDVITIKGNPEKIYIKYLRPAENVDEDTLEWINKSKTNKQNIAEETRAKAIICDCSIYYSDGMEEQSKILIHVDNPKIAIALIAEKFFISKPKYGIHETAYIHPDALLSGLIYIGPNCSIGKCTIGDGTIIHSNVTIYDGVTVGRNVTLHAGAVIGTDGLGCERREDGTLVKFPHLGSVQIEDNVEIGANCQIARGALKDTIIGSGCKINGLCFIAHNCILGREILITGNSMLAGSVKIDDFSTIYSGVVIREQRHIGKYAIIGMGSIVTKDVPERETWFGNPAKRIIR
jgi:UDP-3-O-[3-hydroxymyristoyl] glucosamine N-acyltransferase